MYSLYVISFVVPINDVTTISRNNFSFILPLLVIFYLLLFFLILPHISNYSSTQDNSLSSPFLPLLHLSRLLLSNQTNLSSISQCLYLSIYFRSCSSSGIPSFRTQKWPMRTRFTTYAAQYLSNALIKTSGIAVLIYPLFLFTLFSIICPISQTGMSILISGFTLSIRPELSLNLSGSISSI